MSNDSMFVVDGPAERGSGINSEEDDDTTSVEEEENETRNGEEEDNDDEEETSSETEDVVMNGTVNTTPPVVEPPPKPKPVMRIKLKLPKKLTSASGLPVPPRKASPLSSAEKPLPPPQGGKSLPLSNKKLVRSLPIASSDHRKSPLPEAQPSLDNVPVKTTPVVATEDSNKDAATSEGKPKSRIRLLKLPLTKKVPDSVQASVASSDDEEDAENGAVVATVISSSGTAPAFSNTSAKPATAAASMSNKRVRSAQIRVRIPPILSPGLRLTPFSSAVQQQESGTPTTPAELFDQNMASAGYTMKARTQFPHRGSSDTRVVGDMFDSNVKLARHFPPLVPPALWTWTEKESATESATESASEPPKASQDDNGDHPNTNSNDNSTGELTNGDQDKKPMETDSLTETGGERKRKNMAPLHERLCLELLAAKSECSTSSNYMSQTQKRNGKRPRPFSYTEMLPVSLNVPYPESFIQEQLNYVNLVQEREQAIVQKQAAEEMEQDLGESSEPESAKIVIPPIPEPPPPPLLKDLPGWAVEDYEDHHPFYPPKAHASFVAHLDKNCFHLTQGRYFGLKSNHVADPNFVGANAPGIAGISAAGGAGLATSLSGSGSTATSLTLTSSFHMAAVSASSDLPPSSSMTPMAAAAATTTVSKKASVDSKTPLAKVTISVSGAGSSKKKQSSPTPNSTTSALRKVIGQGGSTAEEMRKRIIRSAVYASRTGKHSGPFQLGEKIYPDVSKAFAQNAGIKPCLRCKSNKQGAYHCRLRRKHKENDFDGGNSVEEIQPLFEVPADDLVDAGEDGEQSLS